MEDGRGGGDGIGKKYNFFFDNKRNYAGKLT